MGKTIGIISIKGGVGKTTTVSNLGAVFANQFDKKVLVVDANFSAPNLGLHLGIIKPKVTLHDVLLRGAKINNAVLKHEDYGFDIIPGALRGRKVKYPYALKNNLRNIKGKYDVVLLDSSPTLNEEMLATMVASDELLVITSPDYPTLSCTMHAVKVAKQKGVKIKGIILNKVRGKKFELSVEEIEEATGVHVLAVLPDDINVLAALAETKPAVLHSPECNAAIEYKKLCASLIGEEYKDPRLWYRLRDLFFKKRAADVPKHEVNRLLNIKR